MLQKLLFKYSTLKAVTFHVPRHRRFVFKMGSTPYSYWISRKTLFGIGPDLRLIPIGFLVKHYLG